MKTLTLNGKNVSVRRASADEMLRLWGYPGPDAAPPTARFFHRAISSGSAVFFALEREKQPIGELYAFLNVEEDPDFADGETTAYLCAFRVRSEYRGQGLGSALMSAALAELRRMGYSRVTIGVDDERNERLYRRTGFTEEVKLCFSDPCARDEDMKPEPAEEGFLLLAKEL